MSIPFAHFPVLRFLPSILARVSVESLLILWFATTPIASFYIRFPHQQSIITFDRLVFALVALKLLIKWRRLAAIKSEGSQSNSFLNATRFEVAWALVSIVVLISAFVASNNLGYATKMAIDSFWLPLLAFHVSRYHFDARSVASSLARSAIWLAWCLFAIGAFEFATGVNLFPYKGSELIREGELRVNGPFAADSSYAIICLLITLFCIAMPRLLGLGFDAGGRLVYAGALAAGFVASMLPLFRSVALAVVICWMIIEIGLARKHRPGSAGILPAPRFRDSETGEAGRMPALPGRSRLIILIVIALAVVVAESLSGSIRFERRLADPRNAYGRFATWKATTDVALDDPLFGVGLSNYSEYFDKKYNWEGEPEQSVLGVNAADSPHSNPLWILAELGIIGFGFYLASNIYLFLIGYRALKAASDERQRLAAICFLALVFAYWIPGLTLASGYYSDLNLYFFFLLGVLSNKSLVSVSNPNLVDSQ